MIQHVFLLCGQASPYPEGALLDRYDCLFEGHAALSVRATDVKKQANARTAAQTPTIWNRSARRTNSFHFFGGALSCHAAVALLIGTVPMILITIQMSKAIT